MVIRGHSSSLVSTFRPYRVWVLSVERSCGKKIAVENGRLRVGFNAGQCMEKLRKVILKPAQKIQQQLNWIELDF